METIKMIARDPLRRPVDMVTSTSSASDTQKRTADPIEGKKNESQNVEKLKETAKDKIDRIAEAMDSYVRSIQRELKIQVHEGTGNIMVRVISEDSGKVIREIPPKELLDLAARMEELAGTLFDEKV